MTLLEATIKKNREKAKNEGRSEGEIKGKIDVAKKMIDKGMDIQTIIEVTGLPEAKIKTLAKRPTKDAA